MSTRTGSPMLGEPVHRILHRAFAPRIPPGPTSEGGREVPALAPAARVFTRSTPMTWQSPRRGHPLQP